MMDIVALCQGLTPPVPTTPQRRLRRITLALLGMPGRSTMLGLSRWAGQGGSSRTVQRLCATVLPWATLFWGFLRHPVPCPAEVYCVAGDAVVVTQAGTYPPGLERCFARVYGTPVPGLAFFTLALVRVQKRRPFPLRVEQVVRSDAEQAARKAKTALKPLTAARATRRPGRPKGRQHAPQATASLPPALGRITARLPALLQVIATVLSVPSLGLEGHCGHHHALSMA